MHTYCLYTNIHIQYILHPLSINHLLHSVKRTNTIFHLEIETDEDEKIKEPGV